MKVLVTERLSEAGLERLGQHFQVDVRLGLSRSELSEVIAGYDALVIRSATKVDAGLLERAVNLKVIGRAGVGIDNVDVEAATHRGILVINAPTSNVLSAAEHTLALLLAQARNVPQAHAALTAGSWERERWQGVELHGKTLGIVGLGRVGTLVAQRASAFGMHLVAFDPYLSPSRAGQMGVEMVESVAELCARADFITIHLPKNSETVGIIGEDAFERMRPGTRIVNTSRGGLIDEDALVRGLKDGRVAGAAIDVFPTEPLPLDHPIRQAPGAVLSAHRAGSVKEGLWEIGQMVVDDLEAITRGLPPQRLQVAQPELIARYATSRIPRPGQ